MDLFFKRLEGPAILVDFVQFYLEMQGRTGRNPWFTSRSIAEFRRDFQLDHAALPDQLQSFGPSGDNRIEPKRGPTSTVVGAVENGIVIEPTRVIDLDLIGRLGMFTVSFAEDAVLQSRVRFREFRGCVRIDRHRARRSGGTSGHRNKQTDKQGCRSKNHI